MKVCIDAGHGGKDSGAIFNGVMEKNVVLSVCHYLHALLLDDMIDCVMTRTTDKFVPLKTRSGIANEAGADIFISVHINADPDDDTDENIQAKGEELWVYRKPNALATYLLPHIDEVFPATKHRGIKESKKLSVLKRTNMPAVLIELGFVDNLKENKIFSDYEEHKKMATLIYRGIIDYKNSLV